MLNGEVWSGESRYPVETTDVVSITLTILESPTSDRRQNSNVGVIRRPRIIGREWVITKNC